MRVPLKMRVLEPCADARNEISQHCNVESLLLSVVTKSCIEKENFEKADFQFVCSIEKSQKCFVITNQLHNKPIVYASDDFIQLMGYTHEEVLR